VSTVKPRLGVECLEVRDCPSVTLSDGFLVVTGTESADKLVVTQSGGTITTQGKSYDAATVTHVVITGHQGKDAIRNNTLKPATIYGGVGNDALFGGPVGDVLYGGHGRDLVYGRAGNDLLFGGSGIDTVGGGAGFNRVYQGSPGATRTNSLIELKIVNLINAERKSLGKNPLKINLKLNVAAYMHSHDMAEISDRSGATWALQQNLMASTRPQPTDRLDAAGYDNWRYWFYYGEDIAYGYPDAASVVTAWMGSASNRNNILRGTFREIGVSVVQDSAGGLFFTVYFGSRQ
jgi:uncharacterized protein YkwD